MGAVQPRARRFLDQLFLFSIRFLPASAAFAGGSLNPSARECPIA
jgi:hypothetical protein